MSEIDGLAKHEWTAANDAIDAVRMAGANRVVRNAAVPEGTMEPHPVDAVVTTLSDDVERDGGSRHDHHAIQLSGNGTDVAIALHPFNL